MEYKLLIAIFWNSSVTSAVGIVVSHTGSRVQVMGPVDRQFGFMSEMEVFTCYNSPKVTVAGV